MLKRNFFAQVFLIICLSLPAIVKADEEQPNQSSASCSTWNLNRGSRIAFNLWPRGIVPYVLDSSVDDTSKAEFEKAVADYHEKTCIRWEQRTSEEAYVTFYIDSKVNCGAAENCYDGHQKSARLNPGCAKKDTFINQMGNLVCFAHEQDRLDRDNYVQFVNCPASEKYDHHNGGHFYDYLSIEHNQCDGCLKPKLPNVPRCGSPNGLSVLDAEKLNGFYECGGCLSYRFRFLSELSGGYSLVAGNGGKVANNEPLHVCRVYHQGDIVPGKAILKWEYCWAPYNGIELRVFQNFEVLTNPKDANLHWVPGGTIPKNAVPGGRTNTGITLYIGRCNFASPDRENILVPGKIAENRPDYFSLSYNGREYECSPFEILVCS